MRNNQIQKNDRNLTCKNSNFENENLVLEYKSLVISAVRALLSEA